MDRLEKRCENVLNVKEVDKKSEFGSAGFLYVPKR